MNAPCDHVVHRNRGEPQPESVYTVTFHNCHATLCSLREECTGHPVCLDCGNMFREPEVQWRQSKQVALVRSISNRVKEN